MKLTIKSLKQISYQLEIEGPTIKISDLKHEMEKQHNFDPNSMKLLYNGVVLQDEKLLTDYKINEGCTLMMMSSKVKPQNMSNPMKEEKKKEEILPSVTNVATAKKPKPKNESNSTQEKKDYTNEIKQLTDMGLSEDLCKSALIAAKGNVNLAIDYVYNGIPNSTKQTTMPAFSEFLDEGEEDEEGEAGGFELTQETLDSFNLADPKALSNIASIVKVIIAEDPSQLQPLLTDIEETNPEIIDFIREHEAEFKTLIESPLSAEDMAAFQLLTGHAHAGEEDDEEEIEEGNLDSVMALINSTIGQQGSSGNGAEQISFSEHEKEVIERLKSLGFSEIDVVQAYIACEKDEEVTANFLFENKYKGDGMNIDCKIYIYIFKKIF